MSDLGQLLKKARTQKGYTLDELQDITKIRKRYLEAIEDGNYKVLPGNFYVRAFIKSYAEAVGLEPDEVLRLFHSDIPVVHHDPVMEPIRRRSKPPGNSEKMSRWASALLVVAFPLLIVGVIYYYFVWNADADRGNSVEDPAPLTESKADPDAENNVIEQNPSGAANQEPPPEPEPAAKEPELSLAKSEKNTDYYTLHNASQLTVEVEVVGDKCWMAVQKNNSSGEYVEDNLTLLSGDKKQWTFDGSAYFNLGRANAVKVKVNGMEINVGDTANPRRIQIDLMPAGQTT